VATRLSVAFVLFGLFLLAGSAGASERVSQAGASANAYGIKVIVPGAAGGSQGAVSAPPDSVGFAASFSYGSDVTTGSVATAASADVSTNATATASAQVSNLSLFGGEITASSVVAKARGATSGTAATGDVNGSSVTGLTVDGAAAGGGRIPLGDWGYAYTQEQAAAHSTSGGADSYKAYVTALDIHLTAAHGSLPAGTEILVGYAEADVQAAAAPPKLAPPGKPLARKAKPKKQPKAPEPRAQAAPTAPPPERIPSGLQPKLTAGGYVFPVYGPSSFTDSFGAPRADVSWHHGDDIFAPLGAPVLACADGTVFSVGWNTIGGNRLWLRDAQGNEFYYAHLSAYSPLARNGNHVKAGEVLGFVGNTGDAQGTPYHLHFEIHPVSLLAMGYDGVVDPTTYLTAWKRLQDVQFANVAGWLPSFAAGAEPKAGAILLQASDISEANGLDPASLRRAFAAPVSHEGDAGLLRSGVNLPRG
jgi:murein DD-endopeptidase MepM/ murein hydrolase activator NlpD